VPSMRKLRFEDSGWALFVAGGKDNKHD